jgi:hypothetical protein
MAAWAIDLVWMLWRRKCIFPLGGINPRFLCRPYYSLVSWCKWKKQAVRMWTEFLQLKTRSSGGLLWVRQWTFRFHKGREHLVSKVGPLLYEVSLLVKVLFLFPGLWTWRTTHSTQNSENTHIKTHQQKFCNRILSTGYHSNRIEFAKQSFKSNIPTTYNCIQKVCS